MVVVEDQETTSKALSRLTLDASFADLIRDYRSSKFLWPFLLLQMQPVFEIMNSFLDSVLGNHWMELFNVQTGKSRFWQSFCKPSRTFTNTYLISVSLEVIRKGDDKPSSRTGGLFISGHHMLSCTH
jgi:hypothetical protein